MKQLTLYLLLLSAVPFSSFAKNKGEFTIGMTSKYYFNKVNVVNDSKQPNPITAYNTLGFEINAGYSRFIKKGFFVGTGINLGSERHKIDVDRDLSKFDTHAQMTLHNVWFNRQFITDNNYVSPFLRIGYKCSLSSDWTMTADFAVERKLYLNGHFADEQIVAHYNTDDGLEQFSDLMQYRATLGRNNTGNDIFQDEFVFRSTFRRNFHYKVVNGLFLGLTLTRAINWSSPVNYVQIISVPSRDLHSVNPFSLSYNNYYCRNLTLGLHIGILLGKNK